MMRYVGCPYAQERLEAFADGELPMGEQVLVEAHLRWCHTCAARVEDLQVIGGALRLGARAHDVAGIPDLSSMQAEVLARIGTEYDLSFGVRAREVFADMRFLWPALGATAAVALCVVMASGVWSATSAEQPTSLAAMIESLSDPGSNRNPIRLDSAMYIPRVLDDGKALDGAMLATHGDGRDDAVVAVAATVTREGKISGYALLESGAHRAPATRVPSVGGGDMNGVLHAVAQSRFAPAQAPGGRVVAVNMVWLFARTTVKASLHPLDLGTPLTRPVLAAPRIAKPAADEPVEEPSLERSATATDSTTA